VFHFDRPPTQPSPQKKKKELTDAVAFSNGFLPGRFGVVVKFASPIWNKNKT
jgi:hypothetical protein